MTNQCVLSLCILLFVAACNDESNQVDIPPNFATKVLLGEALFNDPILSLNQTQSCATCHNPEHGFIDSRLDDGDQISAVSLGDDGESLGDRNAPTAAYAAFSPTFTLEGTRRRFNKQKNHKIYTGPIGGQFLDGREPDLKGQAGGPPLNPIEMGMTDKTTVVERLIDSTDYYESFKSLYGENIFDDDDAAYAAMTESIAQFEKTDLFAPFDSKYDRALKGEYIMTEKEQTGKSLFFSQFSNCGICHQLHGNGDPINKFKETFSGYEYHNIGVPINVAVRQQNGASLDIGLLNNSEITNLAEKGKYKVPTLRNIAVTEPYMHNGVFRDLKTVLEFYDHFVDLSIHTENPETQAPWAPAEVSNTIAEELLKVGDPMDDDQIEAMVCFLRTLTDQRYEALIEEKGISCYSSK